MQTAHILAPSENLDKIETDFPFKEDYFVGIHGKNH